LDTDDRTTEIGRAAAVGALAAAAVLAALPVTIAPGPSAEADAPAGGDAGAGGPRAREAAPPADHHMHVWSEDGRDVLLRLLGELRDDPPEQVPTFDAGQVIEQLDAAGIEQGVLLSTAYFFGSPDVEVEDERRKVREENDWVSDQAARHPERLVAFFGVDPLADYARDVAERCADEPRCAGMKLHLANSDVDFHAPADVERLRSVFAAAGDLDLAVVVHLQTRNEDFGGEEVDVFVDEVLPAAHGVPVQVAHMGGSSDFDAVARRSVEAFTRAFDDHPERTRNVFFDMGLVPRLPARAREGSAQRRRYEEMNRAFVEAVREVGPDRVVFGTDFPEAQPPSYVRGLREALDMTEGELADLLDDRAPYLP
jgi:predicted TIM-barrel fold metal-dependent hydrolase